VHPIVASVKNSRIRIGDARSAGKMRSRQKIIRTITGAGTGPYQEDNREEQESARNARSHIIARRADEFVARTRLPLRADTGVVLVEVYDRFTLLRAQQILPSLARIPFLQ
jgi:hypothetical protein